MTSHSPVRARRLRTLEQLLFTIGAVALGWYALAHLSAEREQARWARELERQASAATTAQDVSPVKRRSPLERGALVGRLEVPRLGLSVIAREGADARTLRRAVGHVPHTALPGEKGNAAFAGHRDTFFRSLKHIRAGDAIVVTTAGARHRYVVRDTRVVEPTEVSVLDATVDPTLTLVTCYPFNYLGSAPKRFIVRAELADSPPIVASTSSSGCTSGPCAGREH